MDSPDGSMLHILFTVLLVGSLVDPSTSGSTCPTMKAWKLPESLPRITVSSGQPCLLLGASASSERNWLIPCYHFTYSQSWIYLGTDLKVFTSSRIFLRFREYFSCYLGSHLL